MPIASTDIHYRLSGGAANAAPAASLGGAKSSVQAGADIWDAITGAESSVGDTEYRCLYVHNAHATLTLTSAVAWIQSNTPATSSDTAIGLGTSVQGGTEQSVADEGAAPAGVAFSSPGSYATGIALGDIPPGGHRAIWWRRTQAAVSSPFADSATLRVQGDTAA